jgi:predicted dehydrogenase
LPGPARAEKLDGVHPLRLGLIGAGKHGARYVRHIAEDVAGAALAAVCRRDAAEGRRLAEARGAAFHADYRDLIDAPDVEAVVAVVPASLHEDIAERACRAGKPLLIEKPLATTLAGARRIRDRVAASRVPCMVAHTLRFNTVVRELRTRLPEIAPLHTIYLSQRFEPSPLAWLDRPEESGGGVILQTGVHSYDLLRLFTGGEVREVWCQAWRDVTRRTEDNMLMTCRMDGDVRGMVSISRSSASRSGLIELAGARGQLVGDHALGFAYQIKGWTRTPLPLEDPAPTVREALRAFVDGVTRGTALPITPDDGVRAVAVADACYRAAAAATSVGVEIGGSERGSPR